MIQRRQLMEQIGRTFGEGAEREVAESLLGFLARHEATSHITLHLMRELTPGANTGRLDTAIVRTLQYLSGDGVRILDTRFELIEADELPVPLTEEEVRCVLDHQVNPVTGEVDPDIRNKVAIYFCPSAEYQSFVNIGDSEPGRAT